MNKVFLIGRISSDIKLRTTQTKQAIATFSIAINRPLNKNNESVADFINCQVWGVQASNLVQYQDKGMKIAIEGALRTNNWEDERGKHSMTYVLCTHIEYLEKIKAPNQATQSYSQPAYTQAMQPASAQSQYNAFINQVPPTQNIQQVPTQDPYSAMGQQVMADDIQINDEDLPF